MAHNPPHDARESRMRIGVAAGVAALDDSLAGLTARVAAIEAAGFDSVWMGMAWGMDPLTVLAVAGQGTSRLELGSAIVPAPPRHPVVMAQGARTAQAALGGRFRLGIGMSHETMMRGSLGLDVDRPVARLREYLTVLRPLLDGRPVSFHGAHYDVEAELGIESADVPVLVAALGPKALAVTGELADGTITCWVGAQTLASHVVPAITTAAERAGRHAPRVVAILPVALTGAAGAARASLDELFAWYGTLPAFRPMFECEGVSGPGELALVGDEAALDAGLARFEAAGATDLVVNLIDVEPGCAERTLAFLASRLAARRG
jgi:F420-dependent oxidoreductase-like protein